MIASQDQQTPLRLKFYVAGDGVFTRNAITNLNNLVSGLNQNADTALLTEAEVIDVTQAPSVALGPKKSVLLEISVILRKLSRFWNQTGVNETTTGF